MLFLIVAIICGVWMLGRSPRLERSPAARVEATKPAVRAYVDGKPVKSHLME